MEETKKKPVKSIKFGRMEIAVWANQGQDGKPYFNFTITKSYRDEATGDWKTTSFLTKQDLGNLGVLIQKMLTEEIGK